MKRLVLGALLLAAALGIQLAAPVARATTFRVCKQSCPFRTIQAAINAAQSGDTITIGSGTYRENLVINKNLTLVGYGTNYTMLTVANPATSGVINVDARDTVTLQQLQITGGSVAGVFNHGIVNLEYVKVYGSDGGSINDGGTVQLTESKVLNNQSGHAGGGIYNEGTLTVQGSTITGNQATAGGGIFNAGGSAEVVDTSVTFNRPNNCVGVNGC